MVEIDDVDYIKIDVQGAELSIFAHGERLLNKAVIIRQGPNLLSCMRSAALLRGKLAIISHDIYRLYDLSTYLLDKIDKMRGSEIAGENRGQTTFIPLELCWLPTEMKNVVCPLFSKQLSINEQKKNGKSDNDENASYEIGQTRAKGVYGCC
jgi:hypothetical protein